MTSPMGRRVLAVTEARRAREEINVVSFMAWLAMIVWFSVVKRTGSADYGAWVWDLNTAVLLTIWKECRPLSKVAFIWNTSWGQMISWG